MKSVVHAACPHDCPDACSVRITVEDSRATRIQGDAEHPITRGFLCAKVTKYIDRVYSPERVLYPMRRVAPKGQGGFEAFERISWDEALTAVAEGFKSVAAKFGSEAILPYSYGGTLGTVQGSSMDERFFNRLGASQLDRTICASAGGDALVSVYGAKYGTEPEQFSHSKLIIAWGANIHGNNVHLWPFIEEARRNGARLVVIDPYLTRTARVADWYLPINPGTDVALALGMMNVIFSEGLQDRDYLEGYTYGWPKLQQRVAEYPPEVVAKITGIDAEDIRRLAREYASTRPAVIRVNYGVQRSQNGGMAVRAIAMLPCVIGSWKQVGGGLQLSTSGAFGLNKQALKRPDLMHSTLGRAARTLNMSELGRVLNDVNDPPVRALYVWNSNPAAVCPDRNNVLKGLLNPELFVAVHEQFLTDTIDYADIVLPATTFFEHKDLQTAYGHYFVQISNAAIAPVGEARSNSDVFRGLAEKMGFSEQCFKDTDDDLIDAALSIDNPFLAGITRKELERKGSIRLKLPANAKAQSAGAGVGASPINGVNVASKQAQPETYEPFLPFATGFPTQSGKARLFNEELDAKGLDPIASFLAPEESRHTKAREKYPLELLARKADNYLNSTFCNLESHQKLENAGLLEIHPTDAISRGVQEGQAVEIFNDRGRITLQATITGSVQPGVVAARLDWAKLHPEGKNINVLTSQRLTDIGGGATFYSALVEVKAAGVRAEEQLSPAP